MGMAKPKRRVGVARSKRGKSKAAAKKQARATASKMAKRSSKKTAKTLPRKVSRGNTTLKSRPRKQKQLSASNPVVETEILEGVEEPVSGIMTVAEIESVHVTMPDSVEETKTAGSPPEEGMAA
jgi:hypothetical protein